MTQHIPKMAEMQHNMQSRSYQSDMISINKFWSHRLTNKNSRSFMACFYSFFYKYKPENLQFKWLYFRCRFKQTKQFKPDSRNASVFHTQQLEKQKPATIQK